jgi:hypothetical protein
MKPMPRPLSTFESRRRLLPIVAMLAAAALGGCATNIGDQIPANLGGLPAGAPARPATPLDYPAVHDMPPARPVHILDEGQQERLQKDLIKARDRQESRNPKPQPKPKPKSKPKKPADTGTDPKP